MSQMNVGPQSSWKCLLQYVCIPGEIFQISMRLRFYVLISGLLMILLIDLCCICTFLALSVSSDIIVIFNKDIFIWISIIKYLISYFRCLFLWYDMCFYFYFTNYVILKWQIVYVLNIYINLYLIPPVL